ncbi:hypothetical protein [Novipirellula artificiosorum]|nr:hypothetical protein [Novipirellula artificiosorum]
MSPIDGVFWATISWLQCIWLPSLLTAILFRGGFLLRIFGLTLANGRSEPASRLRVLVRMLATGIVPTCLILGFMMPPGWFPANHSFVVTERYIVAGLAVVGFLAVLIYRSRGRLFSDWVAGTYLVAR